MTDKPIEFDQSIDSALGIVKIVIRTRDIVDEPAIQQIGIDFVALATQADAKKLLLDLRNVRFLSSRGLSVIISIHRKLTASERELILLVEKPEILELFGLTHLDQILNIARDENDLQEKFGIGA